MSERERIIKRNNVRIHGQGRVTLMLAHGFGCDQNMWRFVVPALSQHYRLVLLDYVGAGGSDVSAYDRKRYACLEGYAQDLIDVGQALELEQAVLVGHSVSATIGLISGIEQPSLFSHQIMLCPSPCFLNKPPDYPGGFEREDLEELIDLMDKNYIGWANHLPPLVIGQQADPAINRELAESFCSTDPLIAKNFAQATFFSDYRHLLPEVRQPSLLLQCESDSLASVEIGQYMQRRMPGSELRYLPSEGHCPHMTDPERVILAVRQYLDRVAP